MRNTKDETNKDGYQEFESAYSDAAVLAPHFRFSAPFSVPRNLLPGSLAGLLNSNTFLWKPVTKLTKQRGRNHSNDSTASRSKWRKTLSDTSPFYKETPRRPRHFTATHRCPTTDTENRICHVRGAILPDPRVVNTAKSRDSIEMEERPPG